ncbi:MAG: DUF1311 domain-containing protein, partial [Alphaproteobacteria bacterium]|nr:DUF1311 domain-containing protein [Alphaproteobacteria bacterium]
DQPLQVCLEETTHDKDYCAGKVDLCDDVTSGFMMGFCAAIESDVKEDQRQTQTARMISAWPFEQQTAFTKLNEVAQNYFNAHASEEMDLSGSGRAAFEIEEENVMKVKFMDAIKTFESGKVPSSSSEDFVNADRELNLVYAAAIKKADPQADSVLPSKDGLRKTQRLWLAYRDAWVAFAVLRYPHVSADSLKTVLTRERSALIKAIPFLS